MIPQRVPGVARSLNPALAAALASPETAVPTAPAPAAPVPAFVATEENGVAKFTVLPPGETMDLDEPTPRPPDPVAPPAAGNSPAALFAQLQQLTSLTVAAKLANAAAAKQLCTKGLAFEQGGWFGLTAKGVSYLADFGLL